MALKIRLARAGSKKRPYYHVVVADVRSPRDGRFIESLGSWNPLLPKDGERVKLDADRIKHWLSHGALPTDRVLRFLDQAGIAKREARSNPTKAEPGKKAQERLAAIGRRRTMPPPRSRRAAPSRPSSRRPDDGNSRRLLRLPVEKLLDQAGGLLRILPEHVVAGAGKHLEFGLRVGLFQPFLVGEIEQAVLLAP